jgi:DNA-binding IclR family transcriptional regulator
MMTTQAAARIRPVPAVSRAFAILRLLGRSDAPLGVNSIARTLGLVPSTCLHILRALAAEELVSVDPATRRYALGAGMLTLARSALRRNAFAELAQPWLDRLSARYRLTAIGVQVSGLEHMIVVAISRADLGLRLHVDIGSRYPALISATGRCLAAFGNHPRVDIDARFRELRWDRPPGLRAWRAEVAAARRDGYSIDQGNYIRGVTVVAVPVLTAGAMSHGLVTVGVSEQVAELGAERIAGDLKRAADEVSTRLGASGGAA